MLNNTQTLPINSINPKSSISEKKNIHKKYDDPLAKYPLRMCAYSNEVGAALSALPAGKAIEAALWIPALLYFGADIYDKYARGNDGDYHSRSKQKGVEQACFQALASVVLPTAAVKVGQGFAASTTKFKGSGLSASAQEDIYNHLQHSLEQDMFKGDDFKNIKKNITQGFEHRLDNTAADVAKETSFSKIKRFFGHAHSPVAAAKSDRSKVMKYMDEQIDTILSLKKSIKAQDIVAMTKMNKKTAKNYLKLAPTIDDKSKLTRQLLNKFIKNKALDRSILKTVGGFVALASVAVPVDYVVEQYFIKKVIHPGLNKANNFVGEVPYKFGFNLKKEKNI